MPLGSSLEPRAPIEGLIEDIGAGGMRVLIHQPMTIESPLRCRVALGGAAVRTLEQVRWSQKDPASGDYRVGLQSLL